MNNAAKEYGTALFMLACEDNQKKEYAAALEKIKTAFLDNPDFSELLNSPALSKKERLSAIDAVFANQLPERVLSYLKLLCEKGRLSCFLDSAKEYDTLLAASEKIFYARVTSAAELTEDEKKRLIQKLERSQNGKINAEYFIDPSILGGVIIEIDGNVLDGSLRHCLGELKEVINP